jgi:hypothetical protein
MRRRSRTDWNTLAVISIVGLFLVAMPFGCYLHMEAVDWDWRCLFAECRIDK